jgi:hypothetical protein
MAAAVHVRNRVHSGGAGGVLFTLATGRRADLSFMRVFGCPAYVHVDMSQRRKLDDRAWLKFWTESILRRETRAEKVGDTQYSHLEHIGTATL